GCVIRAAQRGPYQARTAGSPPLLPPTIRLTMSVRSEAKNNTPIVPQALTRKSFSWVTQIIDNERTVPPTMQMMQIVKQTRFSSCQPFMRGLLIAGNNSYSAKTANLGPFTTHGTLEPDLS